MIPKQTMRNDYGIWVRQDLNYIFAVIIPAVVSSVKRQKSSQVEFL